MEGGGGGRGEEGGGREEEEEDTTWLHQHFGKRAVFAESLTKHRLVYFVPLLWF